MQKITVSPTDLKLSMISEESNQEGNFWSWKNIMQRDILVHTGIIKMKSEGSNDPETLFKQ